VSHSWTLWAQAFLALPANFILFWIMLFGILPLRLFTLLLGSPFRLLSELSNQQGATQIHKPVAKVENRRAQPQAPPPGQWALGSAPSAVEHTTMNLPDSAGEPKKVRT
jgi:hypothetical protein